MLFLSREVSENQIRVEATRTWAQTEDQSEDKPHRPGLSAMKYQVGIGQGAHADIQRVSVRNPSASLGLYRI